MSYFFNLHKIAKNINICYQREDNKYSPPTRGVTIILENAELSTVQAADILKVSRPYLIKLLDDQVIPHRKVGTHRRIKMIDVMNYKNAIDAERESILDQLVAEAQEQKMGYGQFF